MPEAWVEKTEPAIQTAVKHGGKNVMENSINYKLYFSNLLTANESETECLDEYLAKILSFLEPIIDRKSVG